jgi:hypothetical protein
MAIETPYNAHFERSAAGHVGLALSCGAGSWEEWVLVRDQDWRRVAELLLGRQSSHVGKRFRDRGCEQGSRI